jgi:segregation and condensation protein B
MNESYIKNVIEAALLAAGRPLQLGELAQLFDATGGPGTDAIRAALESLEADYSGRGIEVKETATGYRIQVRRDLANEISRLWPERPPRYSRALLETLALIAYRQPITRAEIEAVRGVAVNPNIIKTVLERNWVRVVGLRDVPGRPELLGTTKEFLDYFGLRSLEDLPPLAELKAMGDINLQLDLAKGDGAGDASAGGGESGGSGQEVASAENGGAAINEENGATAESVAGAGNGADGESGAPDPELETKSRVADPDNDGPELKAATREASELEAAALDDSDLDAAGDDDSGDDDELSAADPQGSSELVAAPRDLDD